MDNARNTDNLVSMTTSWDVELAERVGQAVKRLREQEAPKLSAAKLAERTERYGYALTKAQVSDLELGRKKTITVPELISLALALGVPPVQLLYPELPDGPVEVWPGATRPSALALQWFSGEIGADKLSPDTPVSVASLDRMTKARELASLRAVRDRNKVRWLTANHSDPNETIQMRPDDVPERAGDIVEWFHTLTARIADLERELSTGGGDA